MKNYPAGPLTFSTPPFPTSQTLHSTLRGGQFSAILKWQNFKNLRALLFWARYYPLNNRIAVSWNNPLRWMF